MKEPSLLLQVASQIKIDIPEVPEWYRDDYLAAHGIKPKDLVLQYNEGQILHDINIAWQTYHLTRCATNLINACEHIEAQSEQPV